MKHWNSKIFSLALNIMLMALVGIAVNIVVSVPSTSAEAQQPVSNVRRIGYLTQASEPGATYKAFRQELRDLGYMEEKNIHIDYRSAEIQPHLDKLAADLVGRKLDVIVTIGGKTTQTVQKATKNVPIVFTLSGDPIESGFVESLARPRANLTGITWMAFELGGKRLELLKEAASKVSRVAVLSNPANRGEFHELRETRSTAQNLGMTLLYFRVRDKIEFDFAFNDIPKEKANGLVVFPEERTMEYRHQIAEFAIKHRLPSMFGWREYVEAGGLMAYGPNRTESLKRIAVYVDKILKGVKPADLPVEQPTKFELVINLKTAKQIGLTIPPNVLARADRVIK
jgi:putative ABC transport system substrate-binding protein